MELFRLNELLSERQMTFSDLSDRIEIGRTNLYNYVSETNTTISILNKIANELNVNVSELFVERDKIVKGYLEYKDNIFVIEDYDNFIYLYDLIEEDINKKESTNNGKMENL